MSVSYSIQKVLVVSRILTQGLHNLAAPSSVLLTLHDQHDLVGEELAHERSLWTVRKGVCDVPHRPLLRVVELLHYSEHSVVLQLRDLVLVA